MLEIYWSITLSAEAFEALSLSSDISPWISCTRLSVFFKVSDNPILLSLNCFIALSYSDIFSLIFFNLSDISDKTLFFVSESASVELSIVTTTVSINVSLIVSCKVDFPDWVILLAIAFFLAFS